MYATGVIVDLRGHLQGVGHLLSLHLHLEVNALEVMRHTDGSLQVSVGVSTCT